MKQQTELSAALMHMRENLAEYIQLYQFKAEMCREYYLALIEQGFKENEALSICQYFKISEN